LKSGARAYEKSEDPLWVLENNIPLDYQYYLDQQLKGPLTRLFEPLMDNPEKLLGLKYFDILNSSPIVGDHTRTISMPTPKVGGIIGFAVKTVSCVGCKTPLKEGGTYLMID
jgi:DNA polymerase delta subunit 1